MSGVWAAAGLDRIGVPGLWHLALFGLVLPWAGWRSRRKLAEGPLPPKKRYLVAVIVQQVVFLTISLLVASALDLELFQPFVPSWEASAASAALLGGTVFLLRPYWRRQVERRERRVHLISPRDGTERFLWALVSLAAGVGEEITYRGVLFWVMTGLVGSPVAGVVLCSLAFGLGHLVQGVRAAGIVTLFAVGFHLLVIGTGSLYPAMAVHALYDLIAGLSYGRLAREAGYPDAAPPVPSLSDSPAQTPS